MRLDKIVLKSKRLKMVPISLNYKGYILHEFSDEITKYMHPKAATSMSEVVTFISAGMDALKYGSNLQMVVLHKKTKDFIGCVSLHNLLTPHPEIGVWIKENAQGNKYGLEAVNRLIKWARKNLDFDYLKYPVDRRNIASRSIPEYNKGIIMKKYKNLNEIGKELDILEYWISK